jgi:hypothetical protein
MSTNISASAPSSNPEPSPRPDPIEPNLRIKKGENVKRHNLTKKEGTNKIRLKNYNPREYIMGFGYYLVVDFSYKSYFP